MATKNLSDREPLPPIGSAHGLRKDQASAESDSESGDSEQEIETEFKKSHNIESDDNDGSRASSAAIDRPSEGSARPAIVRGFRRESDLSEKEFSPEIVQSQNQKGVSFTPTRVKTPKKIGGREIMKIRTYDGREVTFITEDTQTDWNWVEEVSKAGKGKLLTAKDGKVVHSKQTGKPNRDQVVDTPTQVLCGLDVPGSLLKHAEVTKESEDLSEESTPRVEGEQKKSSHKDAAAKQEDSAQPTSPFHYPPNDEFGIPMLELSSDTDTSSDEETSRKPHHDDRNFMPSVGPPQILQYIRESEKQEIEVEAPLPVPLEEVSEGEEYPTDEQGRPVGMLGGECEFCSHDIKPFPTLEQQQAFAPEELYCCNQYREFVEYATSNARKMEDEHRKKNKVISVKVHPHHGDKQARKAARERAEKKMREREMQKRQQENTGLSQQANFLARGGSSSDSSSDSSSGSSDEEVSPRKLSRESGTDNSLTENSKESVLQGSVREASRTSLRELSQVISYHSQSSKERTQISRESSRVSREHNVASRERSNTSRELTRESARIRVSREGTLESLIEEEIPKKTKKKKKKKKEMDSSPSSSSPRKSKEKSKSKTKKHRDKKDKKSKKDKAYLSTLPEAGLYKGVGFDVARQMKTINYMLSSQRCMEEGWTLRAPSPLHPDEMDDVFIPEPLDRAMIATGNLRDRRLIERFYDEGQKFLTMFADGTGSVFYPSGNLAISISAVDLGQYTYVVQEDADKPFVLAVFEPNGFASCYHPSGIIRLYMDQFGGLELDVMGGKKRKWSWKDMETHVHAPPFQPICFGLNKNTGIRVVGQDKMFLTFGADRKSCRFNVGSRLKMIAPENFPPKEIDDNMIFLEEKKNKVEILLNRVSTLLKFPKSPKIDKILPPLSLTARISRTEKLKQEKAQQIANLEAKKNKQPSIVVS